MLHERSIRGRKPFTGARTPTGQLTRHNKWGFLDRYMDRIIFAISVFHAFGHQWPCQIIYHPRKCRGFGLSDGEGCECFWHSISKLIAYLRVCGYHQRLYTLDKQVEHAHAAILMRLGQWLLRCSQHCHSKRSVAEDILAACGYTEEFLRAQWEAQVTAQTKPLPRRSRTQGKMAVEEAIRLCKTRDIHKRRVEELEAIMLDPTTDADMFVDAEMHLDGARTALERASVNVLAKERALGVDSHAELLRLVNSPFIAARMNARAVKTRLREKLRARKFELDRLEHSFHKQVNDEKVNAHTESSVRRRDPSIQQLARNYNTLCDQMAQLIQDHKAPRAAQCPEKILLKGLFALDVDDNIWQDVGLNDDPSDMAPPPWLCDDKRRLQHEYRSMREWFAEEWKVINVVLRSTEDESLRYQVQQRRRDLCSLCAVWKKSVQSLDVGRDPLPPWGPTQQEILEVNLASVVASFNEDADDFGRGDHLTEEDDEHDDAFEDEADMEESDLGFVETLDAVDLADSFRSVSIDDNLDLEFSLY
ncbi:hypothetical protein Hypma_013352 [Hypsizygus marmoreus]|uniref:CxC1-like cysteine cluster associated with KDZ transposases domain-containing protein n=1 Tax=Hypsizygus marmoreus TaxID=39966 RepID=A0A369JG34_HYPMA|nr:hypothetical protein Hypma_013352 [Hypsizygus marmoreus]